MKDPNKSDIVKMLRAARIREPISFEKLSALYRNTPDRKDKLAYARMLVITGQLSDYKFNVRRSPNKVNTVKLILKELQ